MSFYYFHSKIATLIKVECDMECRIHHCYTWRKEIKSLWQGSGSIISEEDNIMQLIVDSGSARSKAIEAIRKARCGGFDEAEAMLRDCKKLMGHAHQIQTNMLTDEARGAMECNVTLLMVHAQDHLMNAETIYDMACEIVQLCKQIKNQQ